MKLRGIAILGGGKRPPGLARKVKKMPSLSRPALQALVEPLLEDSGGFEDENPAGRRHHLLLDVAVSSLVGIFLIYQEFSESADKQIPPRERVSFTMVNSRPTSCCDSRRLGPIWLCKGTLKCSLVMVMLPSRGWVR